MGARLNRSPRAEVGRLTTSELGTAHPEPVLSAAEGLVEGWFDRLTTSGSGSQPKPLTLSLSKGERGKAREGQDVATTWG